MEKYFYYYIRHNLITQTAYCLTNLKLNAKFSPKTPDTLVFLVKFLKFLIKIEGKTNGFSFFAIQIFDTLVLPSNLKGE